MMNSKIFLVLLFVFSAASLHAGQEITGKLTDKETTKAVEFATVELLHLPDSALVDAVVTNVDGVFNFKKGEATDQNCLRIKHLSYKTRVVPVIKKATNGIFNQGFIMLEPNVTAMKEVVVNGAKILVTELPDKTVYAVSEGIKKTSVDGIDVLRKIPSVQIDYLNEEIKVDGKTNIVIEVDGVTRSKDYIKKLHPKQIAKFEINNTPSGKYDPETDAVINIITDPNMRYGLKGMIVAQGIPGKDVYQGYMNANLDYGLEKISYYIGGYGYMSNFGQYSNMVRETGTSELKRTYESSDAGKTIYLNTGFNYDPDKQNTLTFNISLNKNNSEGKRIENNDLVIQNIPRNFKTFGGSERDNSGLNTSMYYKHKFDKDGKHNIEFEARYFNSLGSNSIDTFRNVYYFANDVLDHEDPWEREERTTNSQNGNARVSYMVPFDSVYTFGAGLNANYNLYDLENTSTRQNASGLNYEDFRGGAYIDFARVFKKGNIKLGTRFETSNITINSSQKNDYLSVLPYANAQYRFNPKSSVRLGYTRRVIRPSSYELNPFISSSDSLTVKHGNPNLKPAHRDNFQFNYSYRYSKGKYSCTLSPQVFYDYKNRIIKSIYKRLPDNRLEQVPENISNGYDVGGGLSVNTQLSQVMINTYFRYFYSHVDSYKDQILETNRKGWSVNVQLMSPIVYKINFMSYFSMNSPTINAQDEYRNAPMYYLGLRRQLMSSSSIMIMAINPFGGYVNNNKSIIKNNAFYQETKSHMTIKNAIILTFTYNFKKGKEVNIQKGGLDEENRAPSLF